MIVAEEDEWEVMAKRRRSGKHPRV